MHTISYLSPIVMKLNQFGKVDFIEIKQKSTNSKTHIIGNIYIISICNIFLAKCIHTISYFITNSDETKPIWKSRFI